MDNYDGYTLSLFNLGMTNLLEKAGDHSLMCLYSKKNCDCTICAGVYYDDTQKQVLSKALYFKADDFFSFAQQNIDEPKSTAINMKYGWFVRNLDAEYQTTLLSAAGSQYNIWRFQPEYKSSLIDYGADYRFQAGDTVVPYIWDRKVSIDVSQVKTVVDTFTTPNTQFVLQGAEILMHSVGVAMATCLFLI